VPCHQLHLADACIQKGETAAALVPLLRAVACQSGYGFCRSVAAWDNSETFRGAIMARWAERMAVGTIMIVFVLTGVLVWAVVLFRGML
jgi:hypothetical protein